jgi:putative thiamine transport system ATP-binding protein
MGLHLQDVAIKVGGRLLLRVDLTAHPGEIVTVIGPSGCGKSTLLRHIAGVLPPAFRAEGRMLLDGRPLDSVAPEDRRIGLLFQDDLLFPHLSVGGNLLFALRGGGGRAARRARAEAALAEAGLAGFFDRDPATLSGGQRARVALLRVLMAEPRALLLDEPFSKLDPALRRQIRNLVFEGARRLALPALLVTHDAEDAREAAGPVIDLG